MISIRQVRRFIKNLIFKKIRGGVDIFLVVLWLIIAFCVLYVAAVNYYTMDITHDTVDDALTTALLSACVYNTSEYSVSQSIVIYRDVTPERKTHDIISSITGSSPMEYIPYDTINESEILEPMHDSYLEDAYQLFLKNLKKNLKLDEDMVPKTSGITGPVEIEEFSIFNKFYNLDIDGKPEDFRIVKYTRSTTGNWSASPYAINTNGSCYNSLDKAENVIASTSVTARLKFEVVTGTASSWLMSGVGEDSLKTDIEYQRVVSVTD